MGQCLYVCEAQTTVPTGMGVEGMCVYVCMRLEEVHVCACVFMCERLGEEPAPVLGLGRSGYVCCVRVCLRLKEEPLPVLGWRVCMHV